MRPEETLQDVTKASPAAMKVVEQLYRQHPLTGKDLREATGLPRRTLYTAIQRLKEFGILKARLSLRDSRQTYFWLDGQPKPETW